MGYFIQQYDVEMKLTTPVYIEAKHVIPYWTKHRPSQLREVSDLSPPLRGYGTQTNLSPPFPSRRIAACLAVFISGQPLRAGLAAAAWWLAGPVTYEGKA